MFPWQLQATSNDGGGIILGVLVGLGSVLLLLPDMSRGTPEDEKSESIEDELMSLWDRKLREKETREMTLNRLLLIHHGLPPTIIIADLLYLNVTLRQFPHDLVGRKAGQVGCSCK